MLLEMIYISVLLIALAHSISFLISICSVSNFISMNTFKKNICNNTNQVYIPANVLTFILQIYIIIYVRFIALYGRVERIGIMKKNKIRRVRKKALSFFCCFFGGVCSDTDIAPCQYGSIRN